MPSGYPDFQLPWNIRNVSLRGKIVDVSRSPLGISISELYAAYDWNADRDVLIPFKPIGSVTYKHGATAAGEYTLIVYVLARIKVHRDIVIKGLVCFNAFVGYWVDGGSGAIDFIYCLRKLVDSEEVFKVFQRDWIIEDITNTSEIIESHVAAAEVDSYVFEAGSTLEASLWVYAKNDSNYNTHAKVYINDPDKPFRVFIPFSSEAYE